MKLEMKLDNGVTHTLVIPYNLFNLNTKQYVIETIERWLNEEFEEI